MRSSLALKSRNMDSFRKPSGRAGGCRSAHGGGAGIFEVWSVASDAACRSLCQQEPSCEAYEWASIGKSFRRCETHTAPVTHVVPLDGYTCWQRVRRAAATTRRVQPPPPPLPPPTLDPNSCAVCGHLGGGSLNCCGPGGSWEGRCAHDPGKSRINYIEGYIVCLQSPPLPPPPPPPPSPAAALRVKPSKLCPPLFWLAGSGGGAASP